MINTRLRFLLARVGGGFFIFSRLGLLLGTSFIAVAIAATPAKDDKGKPDPSPTHQAVTKTFTWTPDKHVIPGKKIVTLVATDDQGNTTTKDITIEVLAEDDKEPDLPKVSDISIVAGTTDATIRWKTNANASAHADIGFNEQYKKSKDEAVEKIGKDHNLILDQLVPCTSYTYRVRAKETKKQKETVSTAATFATKGCPGEAAIQAQQLGDVPANNGGTVTLTHANTIFIVNAPANFSDADANVQIHQLESTAALAALPAPADVKTFTDQIYDIKALTDVGQEVSSLRKPLTLSVRYPAGLTSAENNLEIYHWQNNAWQALSDCQVNAANDTITCSTNSLSPFALFEFLPPISTPTPSLTPAPVAQSSGSSSGSSGSSSGSLSASSPAALAGRVKTIAFNVATGHSIAGPFSGVFTEGKKKVVTLAGNTARLAKKITIARGNYWLEIHAKHDKPGPVQVAIDVNGKLWKKITLTGNDNKYRTTRVGLLRNFAGATIRFRLLNDVYDKKNPTNADKDRNLSIEYWRLVGQSGISQVAGARDGE